MRAWQKSQKGLSLAETAIVLAVAASVVAAIWVFAAPAWRQSILFSGQQSLVELVQNLRNNYLSTRDNFGVTNIDNLQRLGVFPPEFLQDASCTTGCITTHPWASGTGNQITLEAVNPASDLTVGCGAGLPIVQANANAFRVTLRNLPTDTCQQLPARFANVAATVGLACISTDQGVWLPNQPANTLRLRCTQPAGVTTKDVNFIFLVRP